MARRVGHRRVIRGPELRRPWLSTGSRRAHVLHVGSLGWCDVAGPSFACIDVEEVLFVDEDPGGAEIPKSASDPTRRTREVSDPAGWEVEHGPADLVLTVQQLDSAD